MVINDEVYSKAPNKNCPTRKQNNRFHEVWSTELMDMSEYKIANNKGFRYIFVNIAKFCNYTGCVPLMKKNWLNSNVINFKHSYYIRTKSNYNKKRSREAIY